MDELDLLKKHWNQQTDYPKIDKEEIRKMSQKRSSSIVKWIFIICCLELIIGFVFMFIFPHEKEHIAIYEYIHWIYEFVFYGFILYFIYRFFNLYTQIKSNKSTNELLKNILSVRKNAENYIQFNLYSIYFVFVIISIMKIHETILEGKSLEYISILTIGLIVVVSIVCWLFIKVIKGYYKIIYGFLLKKLENNYNELNSLDD